MSQICMAQNCNRFAVPTLHFCTDHAKQVHVAIRPDRPERDRQIERIREKIKQFNTYNEYELPKSIGRRLHEDLKDELFFIFDQLQAEMLEWVLREIFEVTP